MCILYFAGYFGINEQTNKTYKDCYTLVHLIDLHVCFVLIKIFNSVRSPQKVKPEKQTFRRLLLLTSIVNCIEWITKIKQQKRRKKCSCLCVYIYINR